MSTPVIEASGYFGGITSSTNVSNQRTRCQGIFCASASSTPTIAVYDSATTGTGTTIVATFTPSGGTFYKIPALALNGVYIQIGGTVNCSFFGEAG